MFLLATHFQSFVISGGGDTVLGRLQHLHARLDVLQSLLLHLIEVTTFVLS